MKKLALFAILTLFVFGLAGNVQAYEGASKVITTMTHLERGEAEYGPLSIVSHNELTAGKPFLAFLHGVPKPTFSAAVIREETPGLSLGTKPIVRWQKAGRV